MFFKKQPTNCVFNTLKTLFQNRWLTCLGKYFKMTLDSIDAKSNGYCFTVMY